MSINKAKGKKGKTKMAMSFSQYEICFCISRENDISHEMQNLSMQKMSLTRNMNEVTRMYKDNISAKTYKWSNNAGATYTDLTYKTLMTPNASNQWNPVLLTNADGKVIIDSKYEKYAKMIDKNGGYSGTTRAAILSELTGIQQSKFEEEEESQTSEIQAQLNKKREELANHLKKESQYLKYVSADEFFSIPDEITFEPSRWSQTGKNIDFDASQFTIRYKDQNSGIGNDFITEQQVKDSARQDLNEIVRAYINAFNDKNCLPSDYAAKFEIACGYLLADIINYLSNPEMEQKTNCIQYKADYSSVTVNLSQFKYELAEYYKENLSGTDGYSEETNSFAIKNEGWDEWEKKRRELQSEVSNLAKQLQGSTSEPSNTSSEEIYYSSEEERRIIAFYDQIFTAIDEKGWKLDDNINDSDYMNQVLQNNMYYVTTMKKNEDKCCNDLEYIYDMDIASNFNNFFSVNDSEKQNEALAEYEYEKQKINQKETVIDTRMANLETELKAVQGKKETLERNLKDNVERTMSLFG